MYKKLICISGLNGSGKSTQTRNIERYLLECDYLCRRIVFLDNVQKQFVDIYRCRIKELSR